MTHDKIINQCVARIAEDHRCTIADVNAALDRHPIESDRDQYLRRLLALELVELDELAEAFRDKAIVDRDVAAGALLAEIHERRATLLGLNAPASAAVHVIEHERPVERHPGGLNFWREQSRGEVWGPVPQSISRNLTGSVAFRAAQSAESWGHVCPRAAEASDAVRGR